jgi:hypothetical protein
VNISATLAELEAGCWEFNHDTPEPYLHAERVQSTELMAWTLRHLAQTLQTGLMSQILTTRISIRYNGREHRLSAVWHTRTTLIATIINQTNHS